MKVTFPNGTVVRPASLGDRRESNPDRDFGLYLDAAWQPSWAAEVIDWPDGGLPSNSTQALRQIVAAFGRAKQGERVEVGCIGGLGRTGTVLACMAILAGVPAESAVQWVRNNYDPEAVETTDQEQWVLWFASALGKIMTKDGASHERAWCYFRHLVHTVYREARHLGPPDDHQARLRVTEQRLLAVARRCARQRQRLEGTILFKQGASAKTVDEVLRLYHQETGLTLQELVLLFERSGWVPKYGGPKWATITRTTMELERALRAGDIDSALAVCSRVGELSHNSGKLVPDPRQWQSQPYLRRKWPQLCD